MLFSAPVVAVGTRCSLFGSHFRRLAETGLLKSNLSLMWTRCPELPHRRRDIAENRLAGECRG
jgi:hypothetical protein